MKKLIYFHGFGSSAASNTVKSLAEGLRGEYEVIAPDIPVDPREALPFLKELCLSIQPDLIAGSSMGGMYCQQMFGFKRIIVNPAFFMSKYSHVLQVGTFPFLNPRKDGATYFTITPEIIRHFAAIEEHQFEGITDWDRSHVWGLFGRNDDQVNCQGTFLEHYRNIAYFDGGHRLDADIIAASLIPLIHSIDQ